MSRTNVDQLAAIENYIKADRTDPFTRSRIAAHMKRGIASSSNGYEADVDSEPREFVNARGDTIKYTVPVYTNIKRP